MEEGHEDGKHQAGDILTSMGRPVKRRGPPPCEYDSCPKGHWQEQKMLAPCNLRALVHYEECLSVGHFPDDPIVQKNARVLAEVNQVVKLVQESRMKK